MKPIWIIVSLIGLSALVIARKAVVIGKWGGLRPPSALGVLVPPVVSAGELLESNAIAIRRMDRTQIASEWPAWLASTASDPFGYCTHTVSTATATAASPVTNLMLSAIWCQPELRMAVVNGIVVREGSVLFPFCVQRIGFDEVTFTAPSGVVSVRLVVEQNSASIATPLLSTGQRPGLARSAHPPGG